MEKPTKVEVAAASAMVAEELAAPGYEDETLKQRFMRYVGALFFEKKEGGKWTVSIGRISWWLAFAPALYVWIDNIDKPVAEIVDITGHHLSVLMVLAAYNFGKHVKDAIASKITPPQPPVEDGPG